MASDPDSDTDVPPSRTTSTVLRFLLRVIVAVGVVSYGYVWYDAYGPYGHKRVSGVWDASDGSGRSLEIGKGGWVVHSPDDDWDDELWHGLYHKSDSGWVFKRTDGLEIDVEMSAWLNEITFDGVVYER